MKTASVLFQSTHTQLAPEILLLTALNIFSHQTQPEMPSDGGKKKGGEKAKSQRIKMVQFIFLSNECDCSVSVV